MRRIHLSKLDWTGVALMLVGAGLSIVFGKAMGWLFVGAGSGILVGRHLPNEGNRQGKQIGPTGEARPKLEVRFSQNAPYRFTEMVHDIGHYRIGIYNHGPITAENVEVFLSLIDPRPHPLFPADYPYRVRRESSPVVEASGCRINPKHEELFEFLKHWLSSGMGVVVDGIDTKNERGKNPIPFERYEYWHMRYTITCANAGPQSVVFFVCRDGDSIVVKRILAGPEQQ